MGRVILSTNRRNLWSHGAIGKFATRFRRRISRRRLFGFRMRGGSLRFGKFDHDFLLPRLLFHYLVRLKTSFANEIDDIPVSQRSTSFLICDVVAVSAREKKT
jgi:hypothetical protein